MGGKGTILVAHRGDYVPCCVRCKGTTDCGHVRDRFLGRNAIHQESESIAGSALVIIIIRHANYGTWLTENQLTFRLADPITNVNAFTSYSYCPFSAVKVIISCEYLTLMNNVKRAERTNIAVRLDR